MTKTLALILNHNTPELTDVLYENLKHHQNEQYDLAILDNGSSDIGTSKYTSYKIQENVYYGGGLNAAMAIMLNDELYDSLLFLNSDLIIHGYNFVKTLRREMFNGDYKIVSPAIIQPETEQCFWKNIHNWGSNKIRDVSWVDFQSPLIHIDLIKKINQFDDDLIFGWGNDVYAGMVCNDNNWKIGVVDYCTIVHLNSYTIKKHADDPIIKNYNRYAESNMFSFFKKINRFDEFIKMRDDARNYSY